MNEEFESLPFMATGEMAGEMAFERGRLDRMGGMARQPARAMARGRPKPRPPAQPQPPRYGRPRRRPPVFGPYYGAGWPYAVPQPYPEPFPYAQAEPYQKPPQDEPQQEPDYAPDDQGEVPPTLAATIGRLPAAQRPPYLALGAITGALDNPAARGAGLYVIEFTSNGRQRAYSGQTDDLRRRLQQHMLCAQMMGLPLVNHQVYVAQMPALSQAQRRALERRIHTDMFARSAGVLTNQRREMEQEILGYEW